MTAWGHLPNAAHIDQVLFQLNNQADDSEAAWSAASNPVRWAARREAVLVVSNSSREASKSSAWSYARDAVTVASWSASRDAILALIAYDHAGQYMTMTPGQAQVWGTLRGDIAYTLLRPYLRIRAQVLVDIN